MQTWRPVVAGLLVGLLAAGCSATPLLTKEQYGPSRTALALGAPAEALARFPHGEEGTFITTMERTYLSLLQGRPDIDALARYSERIEDRVRYQVSRELKSFFYVETPEGYYASEHEIVWMHLLLGWGYSLRGQYEDGCVEARKGSHLLSARWSEEGRFDDPTLRSILGVLWALCGSWEDAQVDFRRAWEMDPSLGWAMQLGQRDVPPRNLFLVLGGIGPTPEWNPELGVNPLRSLRNIRFRLVGRGSKALVDAWSWSVPLNRTPDASPWYARHQARDNAIHELIADSRYGIDSAVALGEYAATTGVNTTILMLAVAGGIAIGGGIIYLTVTYLSGEAVGYGIMVGIATPIVIAIQAKRTYDRRVRESRKKLTTQVDPSPYYRFVRFLPDYVWIGWNDEAPGADVWAQTDTQPQPDFIDLLPSLGTVAPNVYIGFLPDVAQP